MTRTGGKAPRWFRRATWVTLVVVPALAGFGISGAWSGAGNTAAQSQAAPDAPRTELPDALQRANERGSIGVGDQTGAIRGTIPFPFDYARYPNRLIPVTDSQGTRVGYIGEDVGFIERAVVESDGFDLAAYRASRYTDSQRAALEESKRQRLEDAKAANRETATTIASSR